MQTWSQGQAETKVLPMSVLQTRCRWARTPMELNRAGPSFAACCPYAMTTNAPFYAKIEYRCCPERPWLANETRVFCPHKAADLKAMRAAFPRGVLVTGDSIAQQWYLGLVCSIAAQTGLTPPMSRKQNSLSKSNASEPLPPWCHGTRPALWMPSFMIDFEGWRLGFLRHDCPIALTADSYLRNGLPLTLSVKDFDVVFTGSLMRHTFNDYISPAPAQACMLDSLRRSAANGSTLVLLEPLPSFSTGWSAAKNLQADPNNEIMPANSAGRERFASSLGCRAPLSLFWPPTEPPSAPPAPTAPLADPLPLEVPLPLPLPLPPASPMAPRAASNGCSFAARSIKVRNHGIQPEGLANLASRLFHEYQTTATPQGTYVLTVPPELLDDLHPLHYVGDRSTKMGRPYIDCLHFCVPVLYMLGFSMLDVLSRLVEKKNVKKNRNNGAE